MHIPEGFLTGPTTAAGAVVAGLGLAIAIRRADMHADNGKLPLAGLAGAFFLVGDTPFIPIGIGTQGHLMGGTLAIALLGPWLGMLTIAVVTVVQALVQGDGGITVLGLNIVNAALVPAFIGWPILRGVQAVIRRWQGRSTREGLALACAVAAYVNVLLAAVLFVVEFHLGHKGSVRIEPIIGGTIGTYALIGIVEALVTAGIVRALLARRPDLVLIAPPELRASLRPAVRRRPTSTGPAAAPPPGTEPRGSGGRADGGPPAAGRTGGSANGEAGVGPTDEAGASATGEAGASATGADEASLTGGAGTSATGEDGTNAAGEAGTSATGEDEASPTGGAGTSATGEAGTSATGGRTSGRRPPGVRGGRAAGTGDSVRRTDAASGGDAANEEGGGPARRRSRPDPAWPAPPPGCEPQGPARPVPDAPSTSVDDPT